MATTIIFYLLTYPLYQSGSCEKFQLFTVCENCVQQSCATTRESDSNSNYEFTNNLKLDKSSNIFQSNNRICCKINVDYDDAEKEHILVFPHHLITELTSDKSSAKIVLFKYTCKILLHFAFTKTIPHKPSSYSCRFQRVLCKQEIIIAQH